MQNHCNLLQNMRPKRAEVTGPQQRTSSTVLSEELKSLEGLRGLFNCHCKKQPNQPTPKLHVIAYFCFCCLTWDFRDGQEGQTRS